MNQQNPFKFNGPRGKMSRPQEDTQNTLLAGRCSEYPGDPGLKRSERLLRGLSSDKSPVQRRDRVLERGA